MNSIFNSEIFTITVQVLYQCDGNSVSYRLFDKDDNEITDELKGTMTDTEFQDLEIECWKDYLYLENRNG